MGIFDKFKNKKDDNSADDKSVVSALPAKENSAKDKAEPKEAKAIKEDTAKNQGTEAVSGVKAEENLFGVLVRPIVTEKSSMLGQLNQYAFLVSAEANKIQVAKAVKEKYGVEPIRVNILNKAGRRVRYGKTYGKTRSTRKAIVFLPEGKSITVYEGV